MFTFPSALYRGKKKKFLDPIELDSLQARWRTDQGLLNDSSEAPSAGDSILTWTSFSGSLGAKTLTREGEFGADTLKYETNQQNGHALLMDDLSGSDGAQPHEYRSANESAFGGTSEITVIMVAKFRNNPSDTIFHDSSHGNQGVQAQVTTGSSLRMYHIVDGVESDSTETNVFGSTKLIVMRFKAGEMLARVNAVSLTLSDDWSSPFRTWSPQNFAICRTYNADPVNNVAFGEILIYDTALTQTQIENIETELNTYWALY